MDDDVVEGQERKRDDDNGRAALLSITGGRLIEEDVRRTFAGVSLSTDRPTDETTDTAALHGRVLTRTTVVVVDDGGGDGDDADNAEVRESAAKNACRRRHCPRRRQE